MAGSGKRRPLDCSPPHELTSNTPFSSQTSKKRKMLVNETNSQASSGPSYEVFLSFRGPDTRNGFTDCLYHDMKDAGILVFRDAESLHVGEKISDELLQAIENSKIYIPIFSKNYAASHWCLQELAHMVDCTSKSNENKEILPIFLDVEPDDVKLKTKLYSKAISKHQKKFCNEAVESWRKALIEVGKIKGWNLKKDDGQGEQIRSVIRMVSVKLKVAYQYVTEHIVGVDDRVEAIIQKLDMGSDGVRFLRIHGMGGVGKTTLAKVVFNKLFSSFDQCCFLVDVRESSTGKGGLVNLQKKLLSKLLGPHSIDQIDDVNDGINKIRGALRNKIVLIVLDDVDEKEQMKSLAENGNWFGLGSRIIVTTRDKSILIEGPNVSTYEVCEMEFDHALKLFSRHAFNSDFPPNHHVDLSKKIVDTLGRLPLALEITGSSLLGKAEELWIDTWKKLQKAPPKDVQKKLMITYEKLEDGEKEVFLDIACFLVNVDKSYPSYMWDDCEYHPHIAIDVLLLMSLIKIEDEKTFWMHDQVRDLGREIVRRENPKHLSERSRVWKHDEGLSILQQKERSCKAEGIRAEGPFQFLPPDEVVILTRDEFANLQNLRFFEGIRVSLAGDFKNLLLNLRWLFWSGESFETTNFRPTNLVVLKLSSQYILEEWTGWDQIREAKKLKVLDLTSCTNLKRTPDLSTWVSLERLVLYGCVNLIEIDPSIGKLKLLISLNLTRCQSLQKLPKEIGCLQALREIVMPEMLHELPETFGNLRSLLTFDIPNGKISKLPYSIGGLVKITRLDLSKCMEIKELPDSIGELRSLVELDLSSTSIGHLPDSIGNLKQLKVLRMNRIRGMTELPSVIGLLEKLEELNARGCWDLTGEIPKEIGRLSHLRILDLSSTRVCRLSATVSHLSNLQTLKLENYLEPKQLPELPLSLIRLTWGWKNWLKYRQKWSFALNYWREEYWHEAFWQGRRCADQEDEDEVDSVAAKEFLRIGAPSQQETPVITIPTSIGSLSQLKTLKLCCKYVQFLPQLPSSLRELQLRDLKTTRSPDFSNLKDLSILTFFRCLLEFSRIFDAESEKLHMELCELRQLDAPLQLEMKRLRSLKMAYCKFLPEVLDLSCMKNLEKVDLKLCLSLVEIRGLEELGSLCSLSVDHCPSLERMSDPWKLKNLLKLRVHSCGKLNKQEIYWIYWNGKFGGDICNTDSFDLSSVFDVVSSDASFGWPVTYIAP